MSVRLSQVWISSSFIYLWFFFSGGPIPSKKGGGKEEDIKFLFRIPLMSSLSPLQWDIVLCRPRLQKETPSLLKDLAAGGLHVTRAVNVDLCINNVLSVARGYGIRAFQMPLLVLLLEDYFKLTSVSWKTVNRKVLFPICKQNGE